MTRDEMLRRLEGTFEVSPNTLTGNEQLADIAGWDSLAMLSFVTMAQKSCGVRLGAEELMACKTVNDLIALLHV